MIIPAISAERYLDHAVAQLPEVIHQRHAALGVLLPLRAHERLADDAGALDGAGQFSHDRLPPKSWLSRGLAGCAARLGAARRPGPTVSSGGGPLQVTDLLLQRVDLAACWPGAWAVSAAGGGTASEAASGT